MVLCNFNNLDLGTRMRRKAKKTTRIIQPPDSDPMRAKCDHLATMAPLAGLARATCAGFATAMWSQLLPLAAPDLSELFRCRLRSACPQTRHRRMFRQTRKRIYHGHV